MKKFSLFQLKYRKFPKAKGPRAHPKKAEKIPAVTVKINPATNVIFIYSTYHGMTFLFHHTGFFFESCLVCSLKHNCYICVDSNRFCCEKKIHTYIKYALFYLAVRNVERKIVSHVVTGVQIFQPIYITTAAWNYCLLLLWILRYWVTQTSHGECLLLYICVFSLQ